jgi:hypothetical protein
MGKYLFENNSAEAQKSFYKNCPQRPLGANFDPRGEVVPQG